MKMNKWVLVIALVMSVAMATTGTLAYLTDRDSKANVLTFGNVEIELNEDFSQGSTLLPKVDVEKKPTITNTGKTDAWVWAEIAIPAALDNDDASKNVLHFNYDKNDVNDTEWTWKDAEGWMVETATINGVEYKVYTVMYQTALKPGDMTSPVMTKVYLDAFVDIDPDGNMYRVYGGEVTGPFWNIKNQGAPVMYVSAYALQADANITSVQDAYALYNKQWGENGSEYADPAEVVTVTNDEELAAAIASGKTIIELANGTYHMPAAAKGKNLTIKGTHNAIIEVVPGGQGEAGGQLDYNLDGSNVTFEGVTIKTNNKTYAGYARLNGTYNNCVFENQYCLNGTSKFNNCVMNVSGDVYNVWTWGAPTATFTGCTFNNDGKAVLLYGTVNTKLTLNDCTFNDKGGLDVLKAAVEIGNDYDKSYELIVNNATVIGYAINDAGIDTGSTLWANKNSMGSDKLNVVIDGVDIY